MLGPDTDFTLSPLAADQAEGILRQLLAGYLDGTTDLLPLACRTGFSQLCADDERKANPALVYEGGYNRTGECDEHPGYRRFWPTYALLREDPRCMRLIRQLYRPLYRHALNTEET
jgi:exodeoxyribonuclease V gamma subunit